MRVGEQGVLSNIGSEHTQQGPKTTSQLSSLMRRVATISTLLLIGASVAEAHPVMMNSICFVAFRTDNSPRLPKSCEEARAFSQGLLLGCRVTPWEIRDVTISRSTLTNLGGGGTNHNHKMWTDDGPFSLEQFIDMLGFDSQISNDGWAEYILKTSGKPID